MPPAAEQALACCDKPELSGSASGSFTYLLLRQASLALNHPARGDDPTMVEIDRIAARQFLRGVAPRDPVEGMLATQMLGLHEAAMECLGRAAVPSQYPEARHANLAQANKLTRSFAALVEALDRHRGKGRQVVRVEHVTVNAGGQAIVGAVTQGGGGMEEKVRNDPMHLALCRMNRASRCGARTRGGSPCRSPAVRGRRRCRMHGGAAGSGAPPGNRNAWRHGGRTAEAMAVRRLASGLAREARRLAGLVG